MNYEHLKRKLELELTNRPNADEVLNRLAIAKIY